MITPRFTFNAEANAYLSEPFSITDKAMAHIELSSRAPVVVLRQEDNGDYANFGQTPRSAESFEINITCNNEYTVMLATPVEVTKCYVLN
jgi:hypothetical protein